MRPLPLALGIALIWFAVVYWLTRSYTFWSFLLVGLVSLSLVTLLCYGWDKRAAVREQSRIPEKNLHLLALMGGWPGALIARPLFHHKTRKQPFSTLFWCSVVVSAVALGAFLLLQQTAPARHWLDGHAAQWQFLVQQYLSSYH
ncbi:DUF1294 domain-containing protein [Alcanivorax sp. DP30]|uniref:DUF1294 domain-containing protein n=1 Tax=Alcanivorax sp. DP30 TaxID=2606217 RepID=UPI001925AEF3|nr:DUF1294 domain-containing protein [Alcanivorax sp. DP30]